LKELLGWHWKIGLNKLGIVYPKKGECGRARSIISADVNPVPAINSAKMIQFQKIFRQVNCDKKTELIECMYLVYGLYVQKRVTI